MLDIQKTIQFCGDSFCAHVNGYPSILANLLNAKIVGLGKSGTAHEQAIQSYQPDVDYTFFAWTEATRVHHPTRSTTFGESELKKDTSNFHDAVYNYYKYIMDFDYHTQRQIRDLYWFDKEVLSKSSSKIIHSFGFKITYTFENGLNLPQALSTGMVPTYDDNLNHLSDEKNKKLALYLFHKFTE
ncbi:MAG: hypothetical protein ACPHL8_06960 [Flavobacteriales bacterium]